MRTVVKVGTHAIAAKSGRPDDAALKRLVGQICALRRDGHEVVFVSSGAVAAGVEALGLSSRPASVHDVQMCAAVASGIDTWIANGRRASLVPIFAGKSVGTFFPASTAG